MSMPRAFIFAAIEAQAGRAARPDIFDHRRQVQRMPLGVSRNGGPQRRS